MSKFFNHANVVPPSLIDKQSKERHYQHFCDNFQSSDKSYNRLRFHSKWPHYREIQIFLARLDTKVRNVNSSRNARTGQLLWSWSMFLTGMVTRYFALIFFILGQCSPGFPATNEAGISETSSLEENLQLSGINDCR